jgi:hypothetical protein
MTLSEYERLVHAATDEELSVLEDIAERAGLIHRDEDTGWVTYPYQEYCDDPRRPANRVTDNRVVHRPGCDCNECLVGMTRAADDWNEYEQRKR